MLEHEDSNDGKSVAKVAIYDSVKAKPANFSIAQIADSMLSDFDMYIDGDSVPWKQSS